MKKLLISCALLLILGLTAGPVVADPNLCFDFDGDAVCDTYWELDGTETVKIYLVDWDTSPWPSDPLWAVQMFFYYDHTKIDLNIENSFPNDTLNGGPFEPTLSQSQSKGDGKYLLTASHNPLVCTTITDNKILLWTLELEGIASGTSDIYIRVDFDGDPDHGAIIPGGDSCSASHLEDGGDGYAEVTTISEPEPIPTLSEWGMIIFMFVLMGTGAMILRKHRMV